ncbi:hypothetical protein M3Y97_00055900 [Aphelenchoides bicaudatus]|nr:hypothetical protein M3Y97_00055900 [Aphelenchoides bicaudatus]
MATFESSDGSVVVWNTNEWVERNQQDFKPPVCNKCMFSDQLKVFFVGGPNSRKDYHLEEGEEIFYQIKGDMVLKVVEQGVHKDIKIKEGELFLLPAYVEHSPQRFADTLGVLLNVTGLQMSVIVFNSNDILWERWFHLSDVVKDLPPVIKQFNESEANKTGKPTNDSFACEPPYKPKSLKLAQPINMAKYIDEHLDEINKQPHPLFADQNSRAKIILYGKGDHKLKTNDAEMVLLFQRGEGELLKPNSATTIKAFYTTRLKPNTEFTLKISDGVCLAAQILPNI